MIADKHDGDELVRVSVVQGEIRLMCGPYGRENFSVSADDARVIIAKLTRAINLVSRKENVDFPSA